MFSSLNRWNNRVNTSWDKNANTYTGGGYRYIHKYASVPYTVLTTIIRRFVRPVMHHSVCFRQHRFMLSFLRACLGWKQAGRYMAAGDGKVSL